MNLNDDEINNKYFNLKFDLRDHVKGIVDKYFPNVGWRWLGGN
jgi:hypothetical protein